MAGPDERACPACGATNPAAGRFCTACGTRVGAACPACGAPAAADHAFCGRCGTSLGAPGARTPGAYTPPHLAEKILGSRSALEGERKQVTVLFADVKGSMDLAERVDAEAWHGILDRFFAILAEGVHRFEGTINQFTGDGIMALFGAPIAHEDHALRACWAALHLVDALRDYGRALRLERGLDFSVRMGINSGEVVVGRIGDDLRMDYTAQGHTVGLAARMEQIAEAGKVYVTEHTAALVTGFFRLEELGRFAVKGTQAPVRVYELAGTGALRTRFDLSRARGFSRFVGRETETAALDDAVARAITGDGGAVGVVGEPGVGKSRLCAELVERCRSRGVAVLETHALAHGRLVPFLPFLELLRGWFGVAADDEPAAARRKVAGTLVLLDDDFRDALPLVFDFLGVRDPERPPPPATPEARRRAHVAFLERLVRAQSRRAPAVIVFDDLHWIDGGSATLLDALAAALPGSRMLLVVNFRPGHRTAWMDAGFYRELAIRPLDAAATDALVADLLGDDPSIGGLAARIRERTAGNPFFIEELVRTLAESGVLEGARGAYRLTRAAGDVAVPATVQSVLEARIDRLAERDKAVLQTAAVIGKEFALPVLARVAGLDEGALAAALAALTAGAFVHERALHPVPEYAFVHPLTQEVAYRSQLGDRRARIHAAVARAIEAVDATRLEERAALVAHHREAAGDALAAARWYRRAARWVGISNFPEALRHWQKVRTLVAALPPSPEADELTHDARSHMLSFGIRVGTASDDSARALAEMADAAARTGDPRNAAVTLAGQGMLRVMSGDVDGALAALREANGAAAAIGDPALTASVRACLVLALHFAGEEREALALADRTLADMPPDPLLGADTFAFSPYLAVLMVRALVLREVGRLVEAGPAMDAALAAARDAGALEIVSAVEAGYVDLAGTLGAADIDGLAHARRSVHAAEKIGSDYSRVTAYSSLGRAHMARGEWAVARELIERSQAIARESGVGLQDEPFLLAHLGEIEAATGDPRAAATAREAVAAARRRRTRLAEIYASLSLARVLLATDARGTRAEIAETLDRVLVLADETGTAVAEPLVRIERAALAAALGDDTARRRELRTAARLLASMGAGNRAAALAADAA